MSLKYKHSSLCLDLQPWVNYAKEKGFKIEYKFDYSACTP